MIKKEILGINYFVFFLGLKKIFKIKVLFIMFYFSIGFRSFRVEGNVIIRREFIVRKVVF